MKESGRRRLARKIMDNPDLMYLDREELAEEIERIKARLKAAERLLHVRQ